MVTRFWIVLSAAWLAGVAFPCHAERPSGVLKPIPDKPESEQFKEVPAPWRDYLIQARIAEQLDNPLDRCLRYPDVPGNRWPVGHAEAHCRFHAIKVLELDEIETLLDRGKLVDLESVMAAYLAKHFSDMDFGEDIHVALGKFGDVAEQADRVSARWLEAAPASAFANVARANYLRNAGWEARGGGWASETPADNFVRMKDLMAQAVPLYREAIRLDPRLMPAYAGMLNLASSGSYPALGREMLSLAAKHDPACVEVARQHMRNLQPRWGGSYEEMLAFAAQLTMHVSRRPLLALHVAAPYGDRGDRMVAAKEYTRAAMNVLDIAVRTGSNESHLHDAATVARNLPRDEGGLDIWKQLSLLLQESRFNEVSDWARLEIARYLVRREPEWSLRYSVPAAESQSDHTYGQYLLAAGYYNTKQFDAAEYHYLRAAEGQAQRQVSLRELSTMWLFDAGLDRKSAASKARPFIERLLAAYPTDGRGLLLRINMLVMSEGMIGQEDIDTFLRHADRSDPPQARAADQFEAARRSPPPADRR